MAGAVKSYNVNLLNIGPGDLWVMDDVPAAGGRITLTAGTPELSAHPTAKHLGHTDSGSTFTASLAEGEKIFADEIPTAIRTTAGEGSATITATLLQTADMDLLTLLSPGQGTKATAAGFEGVTGGSIPIVYKHVVLIYPSIVDPLKFEWISLYKASNTAGIEKAISRKAIAKTPVTFTGLAISSRAANDQTWSNWKMI
jgi:hypothetical protein